MDYLPFGDLTPHERNTVADQLAIKHAPLHMFMRSPKNVEQLMFWALIDLGFHDALAPYTYRKETEPRIKPDIRQHSDTIEIVIECTLEKINPEAVNTELFVSIGTLENDLKKHGVYDRLEKLAGYIADWFAVIYEVCTIAFLVRGANGGFCRISKKSGIRFYGSSMWV